MQEQVIQYYCNPEVVEHYSFATSRIGLWRSEEKVFTRVFQPKDTLLDLGCGTGRIAFGLYSLGYRTIMGVDIARDMVKEARRLAQLLDYGIPFQVGDAAELDLGGELFDGIIFGFNGLMQIPGRDRRLAALRRIHHHLRPGGWFVFTTHDRELEKGRKYWNRERRRWHQGDRPKELLDFGDRFEPDPFGELFIHVPAPDEVRAALKEAGFRVEVDALRSQLAIERPEVRGFSDDCRFWVAQRPGRTPEEAGQESA